MVDVAEPPAEVAPPYVAAPSLVTSVPLGAGNFGMTLGGGYSVILPLFVFELGYGLSKRFDVTLRYETVAGLFHYPQLAVRWGFAEVGKWSFGARFGTNYSFFAVKSEQTNLTSTLYLSGELNVSRPVTKSTDVIAAVRTDFDLWEFRLIDGARHATGTFRFDGVAFRGGARTQLTTDLSIYVIGNLRIPVDTFEYQAEQFNILPTIEAGGTFVF